MLLQEIKLISEKHTREYFAKQDREVEGSSDCAEIRKIREMFTVLVVPRKSLTTYFEFLEKEEGKKEFRKWALYLHPDKNPHPSSKKAFQKLFKAFISGTARAKVN